MQRQNKLIHPRIPGAAISGDFLVITAAYRQSHKIYLPSFPNYVIFSIKGGRLHMKETGIVRKLDELGRITLPIELRRTLNISERDSVEISIQDDKIILEKYEPVDIFTGEKDNLIEYHGKKVSKKSIIEMAGLAGIGIKEGSNE